MPTSKKESASTSAGNKPRVPQLTVAEKKLYEKLKARQQEIEKQEAEARKDRKSTRLNSSHSGESRMPSSA